MHASSIACLLVYFLVFCSLWVCPLLHLCAYKACVGVAPGVVRIVLVFFRFSAVRVLHQCLRLLALAPCCLVVLMCGIVCVVSGM